MNLRQLAVSDLKKLNLADWSTKIELMDPDGIWYTTDNETGQTLKAIQLLYDYRKIDPDTGGEIVVNEPVVTIALSSLSRVPQAGETWMIKIPMDISDPDTLTLFALSSDRAPEGGASIGFIRLYPQKVEQS